MTLQNDPRPSWDDYYMMIVEVIALRADCTRAQHGAVIVDDHHRIVSAGYNGAAAGQPGCLTAGSCPRGRLSEAELAHLDGGYDNPSSPTYCTSVHAEANAIIYAGRARTVGATIYVTGGSCHGCKKLIQAAGIQRIVFRDVDGIVKEVQL